MSNKEPSKAEVLRGTLDLMVLQTLAALGPQHGYAIGARLEQVSSGALTLNMGTLYPGLMRLEQQYPGLERISVSHPIGTPEAVMLEQLEWFAADVMPAFTKRGSIWP